MVKPCAFTIFISEIFSSSGQPARLTLVGDFFTTLRAGFRSFIPHAFGALVFALVVAIDAIIGVVERIF